MKLEKIGNGLECSGRGGSFTIGENYLLVMAPWRGKEKLRYSSKSGELTVERKGKATIYSMLPAVALLELSGEEVGVETV